LKAYLKAQGVPDENVMEEYTPFHHQDYQTIVSKVKSSPLPVTPASFQPSMVTVMFLFIRNLLTKV
jgi:hypothetical protein